MTVRVRFAPSPTGHLHVGGARTALFNYLFARREGGVFVLRIEDTDRERSSDEMTAAILDAIAWVGLEVDEGPYYQADGLSRHRRDVARLLDSGAAYRCFCAPGELEARREAARDRGEAFRYDGRCGRLEAGEVERRAGDGEPHAVRFRVPAGATSWADLVHGEMAVEHESLDDFVILRSDATPVYNLAVVSDDIEMRITHVLRGDDHLSNTPKQILIYRALEADVPLFGHLPMILGTDGKRLSKRHGALSVAAYRDRGILPEAMVNFLALLGWSPGDDREVMDLDELVAAFRVDRILRKSAVFDPEKLQWLNGQHISRMEASRLAARIAPALAAAAHLEPSALELESERMTAVIELAKPRARTLEELVSQAAPFFAPEVEYDEGAVARFWKRPGEAAALLRAFAGREEAVDPWDAETLERELRDIAEELEVSAGKMIHPLRVALMGIAVSPGIFEVLELMGRERSMGRIERALGFLDARAAMEEGHPA